MPSFVCKGSKTHPLSIGNHVKLKQNYLVNSRYLSSRCVGVVSAPTSLSATLSGKKIGQSSFGCS